jgi:DNA-binding transcriptional MocR family regulator
MEHKLTFSLCCPTLPQVALADFEERGACEGYLRSIRRIAEENLARLSRVIKANFSAGPRFAGGGGFVLWLESPRRFDARALF